MKVCWIGLGHMGLPMVTHLNRGGFAVDAHDLSPSALAAAEEAGVRSSRSAEECAEGADVMITMLPTGTHVRAVVDSGLVERMAPDALIIDCSTVSAVEAREIGAVVAATGRRFIDAPVSGGTPGAQNGTLTFMAGGDDADVERARPLFEAMGSRLFHVGSVGCGQSAKTVNNMMLAMNMASVSEAAVLAERLGLEAKTIFDIFTVSSGDSWVLRTFYPIAGVVESAPASHNFEPGFTTRLMRKDVGLALDSAAQQGVDTGVTAEVARQLDAIIEAGYGDLDFSSIVNIARGNVSVTPLEAAR